MSRSRPHRIDKASLLARDVVPKTWREDLLPKIQEQSKRLGHKIVVLDDDPTGTQTVYDVPVLTHWTADVLAAELQGDARAIYLLTNSRSLNGLEAGRLAIEIGKGLSAASRQTGVTVDVISRSDSTLRGHFPGEVDALASAMGVPRLPCLIIPCFFEGGRYTVNDIHYVAEGDDLIPAAETDYARDAAFGYRHSNLRDWVEEKTGGRIRRDRVVAVSLEDIRSGGPIAVERILTGLQDSTVCVVNAVSYKDLEVFVLGLLMAEQRGHRFLFRTAASFVRVRAGLAPQELLGRADMVPEAAAKHRGGLFLVGSYVSKTTAQVNELLAQPDISNIEVQVEKLLDNGKQGEEIDRVCDALNAGIESGRDVVVYTSRRLASGGDATESLSIGQRISNSLIEIVWGLRVRPRYLVAKGGITSSDVATRALGVRRAVVMGQILPGVPVWRVGEESRYPGMAYVVFPGNVGDIDALVQIKDRLRGRD